MGLREALKKTRSNLSKNIRNLLGRRDPSLLGEIEDLLIQADFGVSTAEQLVESLENVQSQDYYSRLEKELIYLLNEREKKKQTPKPPVVELYVGVNGVGKTTTIGKRGYMLAKEGKKVLLASGDTYRTGAVEQLSKWAKRIGVDIITSHYGADSASVAFDAVDAAETRNMDYLLIDTAGRLHTRSNLMEEMRKMKRVISKKREDLPQETILVVDASTGQNALEQAKSFNEFIGLTGIALAKLDGTAKGGMAIAIVKELGIPVLFLGIGEEEEDLIPFNAEDFVCALFE
ncbi:signal recognition particle-docking protein FtsY [candidate division WOR-3 bacterium]|nr:signal recognition particle-docking protein FtsY [candidate division WOR-3 bacterium]MCK4526773.1 signal recognition particle-docking protein FtsY [candidate division WOR-3 bacterium]